MRKEKRFYIIDMILMLLMLGIGIAAFYVAYLFGLLPQKWITIGAALIGVLWLIFLLLSFKKMPLWVRILRRCFVLLLCILLGFSGYLLHKSHQTLNKVSSTTMNKDGTISKKNKLYIVSLKENKFNNINDLQNSAIGFQNGSDVDNASFMKEELRKDISTYSETEALDYTTLFTDLENKTIQAVAISDTYYNIACANQEGLQDKLTILETYEREIKETKVQKDITKETFTVYVSGLDSMGSPDQQTRTDTNIILIVNPRANHIDMVSLPRDGYMPNTAVNNLNDKFTHTGLYGIDTSIASLENFFQIPIDYYARISFNSLIEIVDALGGIDVDVEISFCEQDENRSFKEEDLICLDKGEQTLNGKQALAYSRHRKTPGYDNPGRERAQQRIIKAIINKLMNPATALTSFNELMEIAPNYVMTNMPTSQITKFVSHELENIKPWTISSISSDNGTYSYQYTASQGNEQKFDVYLYNQEEVQWILNAYDGASHQLEMKNFSFDLNDLYKNSPKVNDDPTIVWDYMANEQ